MKTESINSHQELINHLKANKRAYLLLHKQGSDQSECAYRNLQQTEAEGSDFAILTADVTKVRDIHPAYNITSVPSLLDFENGQFKNVIKGCNQPEVLKALFDEAVYMARMEKEGKVPKRVTVYSTPTCSWCNTLKSYLRKNKIRFTDVDVSKDPKLSQDLVARTGQQGVPQTEINGQFIVGFDQKRIDELLEI